MGLEGLILQCAPDVAPETMMAIVKVESNGNPWAIGNNTLKAPVKPTPKSKEEAISKAKYYIAQGHSLDLGLAQINSKNLKMLKLSVDEVFEPCTNIGAGAYILKEAYLRASSKYGHGQKALHHALSAYNTGSLYRGHGYVTKVVKAANNGQYVDIPKLSNASLTQATSAKSIPSRKSVYNNSSQILVINENKSTIIVQ